MKNRLNSFGVIVLAAVIGFGMAAIPAGAQQYNPESDFQTRQTSDGSGVVITKYIGISKTVNVPPRIGGLPVVGIGNKAFPAILDFEGYPMPYVSITIPNTVVSIGDKAFSDNRLSSIVIPSGVTAIGDNTFEGNRFTSVIIPDNVTSIGKSAFASNHLMTSIVIPNNVTSIGESAFRQNIELTSVTIGNSVTSIGDWAFASNRRLAVIVIPDSVTRIGDRAFEDTALTSITIGGNLSLNWNSFPDSFVDAYNKANKQAGTYVLDDNYEWVRQ